MLVSKNMLHSIAFGIWIIQCPPRWKRRKNDKLPNMISDKVSLFCLQFQDSLLHIKHSHSPNFENIQIDIQQNNSKRKRGGGLNDFILLLKYLISYKPRLFAVLENSNTV